MPAVQGASSFFSLMCCKCLKLKSCLFPSSVWSSVWRREATQLAGAGRPQRTAEVWASPELHISRTRPKTSLVCIRERYVLKCQQIWTPGAKVISGHFYKPRLIFFYKKKNNYFIFFLLCRNMLERSKQLGRERSELFTRREVIRCYRTGPCLFHQTTHFKSAHLQWTLRHLCCIFTRAWLYLKCVCANDN